MNKSISLPTIFLAISTFCFSTIASSQSETSFHKWTVKTGFSRIYAFSGTFTDQNPTINWYKASQYQLSGLYHPSRFYAAGIYAAFSSFPADNPPSGSNVTIFTLGVKPELYITPLIFPDVKTRFDIYAGLKLGARYVTTPTFKPSVLNPKAELGAGGGLAWYPWKRISIFSEYYYGKQANPNQKHSFSFGAGVKF